MIKLTYQSGSPVYVNPAQIVYAEAQGDLSRVYVAVPGRAWTDAGSTDAEPHYIVVTESLERIAAACLPRPTMAVLS